jgi:hypothetical protein
LHFYFTFILIKIKMFTYLKESLSFLKYWFVIKWNTFWIIIYLMKTTNCRREIRLIFTFSFYYYTTYWTQYNNKHKNHSYFLIHKKEEQMINEIIWKRRINFHKVSCYVSSLNCSLRLLLILINIYKQKNS